MPADNLTTILISAAALGIIVWGYVRSRRFGRLGLISWLQSLVLMTPWLLFFGLFAVGIYLNFSVVVILLVLSSGVYIYLGRQVRELAQDPEVQAQLAEQMAARRPVEAVAEAQADQPAAVSPDQPHPIPREDLDAIRGIFGIDTFFATETIPYQEGAIFKGNLRSSEPGTVQARLAEALEQRCGDRYRLYLVADRDDRPVVIVLPRTNDPKPSQPLQWALAGVLALATAVTCLERGGLQEGIDLFAHLDRIRETLPIGLGILTVLAGHEIAHRVVAAREGVKLSPPFFIPAWQIGSFGAITRFESVLRNRSQLFDIAFAGPAVGGMLGFAFLGLGLFRSIGLEQGLPLPTEFFQGSVLVGTLAKAVLGDAVHRTQVLVDPFVVVGWVGLVISALNLLPAGQLDGGRMVQAIYGRRTASRISLVTIFVLAIASFANPLALYWAVLILVLQRLPERPSSDELSEPDDTRAALCLLALFLTIALLLPISPGLAGRLGIGI